MRGPSMRPQLAASQLLRPQTAQYICRQCMITTATTSMTSTVPTGRRYIQISTAPVTEFPKPTGGDAFGAASSNSGRDEADARFEVLGSPYSLLSVSLSASQNLYTRRGTLVSVAGKVENAQSTLSLLAPVRRALFGIPFLYQRISSTTPLTLLIGTKAASTTLFTLHLDGTTDWVVAQRNSLLAWTGHTLAVTPRRESGMGLGLAHWGSSFVTGRGLVALSAPGYIYPVTLAAGEELVVHPSHVVAYAVTKNAPQPFRLKSGGAAAATGSAVSTAAGAVAETSNKVVGALRLQIPAVPAPVSEFWQTVRSSTAYKVTARTLFNIRTVLRRTIWGDRLFVHVRGPTTLLLSSRGVRVSEVLTRDNVNEIADAEAGVVPAAVELATADPTKPAEEKKAEGAAKTTAAESPAAIHVAETKQDGKVEFKDPKDLNEFVR